MVRKLKFLIKIIAKKWIFALTLASLSLAVGSCRLDDNAIRGRMGSDSPGDSNLDPDSNPGEPAPPEAFSIVSFSPEKFYSKSVGITPVLPVMEGSGQSFTVSPSLPAGLTINVDTGEVTGTPSVETAPATYTLTATHADGRQDSVQFNLYVPFEFTTLASVGAGLDANPGDGICQDGGGNCTLIAAISEANAQAIIPVIIHLPANSFLLGGVGQQTVNYNLTLKGASQATTILDAQDLDRVLEGAIGSTLTLNNLTVKDGRTILGTEYGAGILMAAGTALFIDDVSFESNQAGGHGGAISTGGFLVVTNSSFSVNSSSVGQGGAINSSSMINITNSTFTTNSSSSDGGAIFAGSFLTVTDSVFIGNLTTTFGDGGAVFADDNLKISRSQFINNSSDGGGGGVMISGFSGTKAEIYTSIFQNNTSNKHGGGLAQGFFGNELIIQNSSFYNNSTATQKGGNISIQGTSTFFDRRLEFSSLSEGSAGGGGDEIYIEFAVPLDTTHTLIEGAALTTNCLFDSGGSLASGGYNIDSGSSCGLAAQAQPGDLENTSPLFVGPPALNGDTIPNLAIQAASPARDVSPVASCASVPTDQRLQPRPIGGYCDAGAFEF